MILSQQIFFEARWRRAFRRNPYAKGLPENALPLKVQKSFKSRNAILRKTSGEVIAMANGPSYARWSLEPYNIGMKLRTLRTQKHLTLSRLAVETGLSTALLSKLEPIG